MLKIIQRRIYRILSVSYTHLNGVSTGNEISDPMPTLKLETKQRRCFQVPFSYVDLNGHMNNTHYFDLAEDLIPAAAEGRQLKTISTEYSAEICMGETIDVCWGQDNNRYYLTGQKDNICCYPCLLYTSRCV